MSGEVPVPADKELGERLRQLERRIAELEGARPMMATTMKGGTFILATEAGDPLLIFGASIDKDGNATYAIQGRDANDDGDQATNLWLASDARGLIYPYSYHQWVTSTAIGVTSGTFQDLFECRVIHPNGDTLQSEGIVITPAGVTAEVRIRESAYGDVTNVVTVPASSQELVAFEWQHPWSVGYGDATHPNNSPFLHWEVRVASGAGTVNAYPPRHLTFRNQKLMPLSSPAGGGRLG